MRFLTAALATLATLAAAFENPIRSPGGADPFVTYSGDGYYYYMSTSWTDVQITRSKTIEGLATGEKKVIFSTKDADICCNVWAPEVHWFEGAGWFVYFTSGNADNLDGQRLHVLKGGDTPWDQYAYAGTLTNEWSIDASILRTSAFGNFLIFSCFHGAPHQSLCIQALGSDHVSVTGDISVISQPTEPWETVGTPVNEGPAPLYFNDGVTYVAYSASYCWTPSYCLGLLTWDMQTDPRDPAAWTKSDGCLFASANGNFGTGHNSFFQSADGGQFWNAYHATSDPNGNCDNNRYTSIQQVNSASDGTPDFGIPLARGTQIQE
ncbi:putative glycosyl hydrolase, family 43 [Xylariomycetidae sp. FL0641]|nr:putative glycosyl hydrolase, family 43 [Xylariomycetidae sp. FL0641]